MGYTLMIGEFSVEIDHEKRHAFEGVEPVNGVPFGAPLDSTGNGTHLNQTWPGYIGWSDAMKSLGLYDVFFGTDSNRRAYWTGASGEQHEPIIASHPGVVALTPDHLAAFRAAAEAWTSDRAVTHRGSYMGETRWTTTPATADEYLINEIRVRWLVWWTEWALTNCRYPSFANS